MKIKKINQIISLVLILTAVLMLAGCSQPLPKPDPTPETPQAQTNMMGQGNLSSTMHDKIDDMQKAMSNPENRQPMVKMMTSPQMRPAMIDMMKDPGMRQAMTDIMADPAMEDTFAAMVKDPRLAPIARKALK